jgi:hypothetical protein
MNILILKNILYTYCILTIYYLIVNTVIIYSYIEYLYIYTYIYKK